MDDRRKRGRVNASLDSRWEGVNGSYTARIADLSQTGCYCDSMHEVAVGDIVTFTVELPTGEWLPLTGKIVYTQPYVGFGVHFVDLTDEQTQKIGALIHHLLITDTSTRSTA